MIKRNWQSGKSGSTAEFWCIVGTTPLTLRDTCIGALCFFCYYCNSIFFPEGGVGLVPKRGCLLTLAYYALPRWYEFGERRWNDILTGKNRRTRRKTCPSVTLSTTNPTWIDPGANPGLRGERPATNDLSHGTDHCSSITTIQLVISV
jgi:hypothetical protein